MASDNNEGSSTLNDDDNRYVTMLNSNDRDRILNDNWVDNDLNDNDRLLLVRNSLHVAPPLGGVFVSNCFCQPPIISF